MVPCISTLATFLYDVSRSTPARQRLIPGLGPSCLKTNTRPLYSHLFYSSGLFRWALLSTFSVKPPKPG